MIEISNSEENQIKALQGNKFKSLNNLRVKKNKS